MNYLAKMRVHTLLLTSLAKYKSKAEVKLWFMRKKYFLQTMDLRKKEKLQHKCGILPQTYS